MIATIYFLVLKRHGHMYIQKGAIEVSTVLTSVTLSDPAMEEAETVQHSTAEFLTPTKQNTRERQSAHLVCASPWLWSLALDTKMNTNNTN